MSEGDLTKQDIEYLFECITNNEIMLIREVNVHKNTAPPEWIEMIKGKQEQAIVLKSKLLRMRDGIDIDKGLKELENEDHG